MPAVGKECSSLSLSLSGVGLGWLIFLSSIRTLNGIGLWVLHSYHSPKTTAGRDLALCHVRPGRCFGLPAGAGGADRRIDGGVQLGRRCGCSSTRPCAC